MSTVEFFSSSPVHFMGRREVTEYKVSASRSGFSVTQTPGTRSLSRGNIAFAYLISLEANSKKGYKGLCTLLLETEKRWPTMKYKVKGHFPTPQTRCLVVQVILCPIGKHGCFMFALPSERNPAYIKDIALNFNSRY